MFGNLGGMGRGGARGGRGGPRFGGASGGRPSMFDEDDHMSGFGGMPGGMPGGRPGAGPQRPSSPEKPSEITKPLKVSLQDLYKGTTKHLKVGRKLLNGQTEDKVLEVVIQPGYKSGTKVRFPKHGNETGYGGEAQDLVFVVEEKPDPVWSRNGNDLTVRVDLPLVEALTGPPTPGGKHTKTVELLDGRRLQVPVPSGVVKPEQKTIVTGEGMPIRKDGRVQRKGDLWVQWNVVFPNVLTATQKDELRKILTP